MEGESHEVLGYHYLRLRQYENAIKHYEMHLKITKETGDKRGEGNTYSNLGVCYKSLSQYGKALENLENCLEVVKQTKNKEGEGMAYCNIGICYRNIGQYEKAIQYQEMCLKIAKQIGKRELVAKTYGNLGTCYRALGLYDKAIQYQEMDLSIAKEIGDKTGEITTYGNLGTCYSNIGQYEKAIEYHELQLKLAQQIGNQASEEIAYGNLGNCYRSLGRCTESIKYSKLCLNLAKKIGDKSGEGKANTNLGSCYSLLGQHDKATDHHRLSLEISKQIGNKSLEGIANGNLGDCFMLLAQYEKAVAHFEVSVEIAKQSAETIYQATAQSNLGICYYALEQIGKAESNMREGLQCYEKLFDNVPKQDQLKVSILDTFSSAYQLLVKTLLIQGKAEEALVVAERGRSKALALLMLVKNPNQHTEATEAKVLDLPKIREVVKMMNCTVLFFTLAISEIYTWIIQPDGDIKFNKLLVEVFPQVKKPPLVMDLAFRVEEQWFLLIRKAMASLEKTPITVKCEDRSLNFFYPEEMTKERSTRWIPELTSILPLADMELRTSQDQITAAQKRSPAEGKGSKDQVKESELDSPLTKLYQAILQPVQQFVKGSQVVVVPDGPLALLPFAALVDDDGHSVAESLQVRLVPSLATAKLIAEYPQEFEGQESPLIVGNPDVGVVKSGDKDVPVPRLPKAGEEAEMIGELLNVRPLTGKQATKTTFLQRIETANLIHIAAHGDMKRGEILLGPSPDVDTKNVKKEDVMVMISNLEGKRLKAKLVVLSCCHSGQGEVKADGVIGIARSFLGAGAHAVVVTLWAIDDAATFFFMKEFYERLIRGEKACEALNRAMKSMRESKGPHCHPHYWAPFVLIGDDVAPFRVPRQASHTADGSVPSSFQT